MRKTSQDGGDTSSITSGVENEIKKPGGIMKTKKISIKRKVQNISNEYDETVIEPLLQNDNDNTETASQSAKYLLTTTKTDIISAQGNENNIMLTDNNIILPANSRVISKTTSFTVPGPKDNTVPQSFANTTATVHNHMNTNVFASHNLTTSFITPKTQILVEIDGTKQSSYSPSPLIFTTAKIHTDGKTNHMEPVQVTSVPILSIIEVSVSKAADVAERDLRTKTGEAVSSSYSIPSVNNAKSMEKDLKPCTVLKSVPEMLSNNVAPKVTTSDYNVENILNKTSPITKASDFAPPVAGADAKWSKTTSTGNNIKVDGMGSFDLNDNKRLKEEPCVKVSQPQSTSLTKTHSNIPVKSISPTSNKMKEGNKNDEENIKGDSTLIAKIPKVDGTTETQIKTSSNWNVQPITASSIDPQHPGKTNNINSVTEKSKNDKTTKSQASSASNRSLQRQKNTKIDDTNDPDVTLKKGTQKESNDKLQLSSQTKISDCNVNSVSDKFTPKTKSINVNVLTTQSVPKVTGTSTGKSISCSTTASKPTTSNIAAIVKSSETTSNQSNVVKPKSSSITKPNAITKQAGRVGVTNVNKPDPSPGLTNVSSVTTAVVATTKTASSTSSVSKAKSPNPTTSQPTPSIKQPITSAVSVTTAPHTTLMEKAPIRTSSSSHESTSISKATPSKDTKLISSNKNPGTSVSSAAAKSTTSTKKGGQKSSEHNNDGKSSKT